jgi:hypothetical protein
MTMGAGNMADEQCIHDLSQLSCAVCSPPARASVAAFVIYDYGPWVEAGFPGRCADCGETVSPGDQIRADGQGGWLCGMCGEIPGEFSRSDWDWS